LNLQGVQGSIIQMLNHGISTGGLFLMVGIVYECRHTKLISEYGGLWQVMPVYTAVSIIIVLSSVGLPSLNGFIGEYLILVGAFQTAPVLAIISASAVILAAIYLLWMVQRVFFGVITNPKNEKLHDLNWRELAVMAPLILFIVWVGVYPSTFLSKTEASANAFITLVKSRATAQAAAPLHGLVAQVMDDASTVTTASATLANAAANTLPGGKTQ
ncbi:MAG TPA: proton-conducting transporter membrane subunit, partial [bacterium]